MTRHGDDMPSGSHSDDCRRRIYAEMAKTDAGRLRPQRACERFGQQLEAEIERRDDGQAKLEVAAVVLFL